MNTIAQSFSSDPRVEEAKTLLLKALTEAQQSVCFPGTVSNATDYKKLLDQASSARGGSLWYPFLGSGIGRGPLVELADGSVKYDFISGIGVHHFGHSHPELILSSIEAALSDTIQQGNLQQNTDSIEVMQLLLEAANHNGADIQHCFLTTSGAMANENALKLMFQKNAPANRMLAFNKCFSGRTMALAQLTDKAAYRSGLPTAMTVDYIPFFDPKRPSESSREAINALCQHLERYPGQHAGMCIELVQGEGGYFPGSHDFFKPLMQILRDHGVAIWADEVQSFGRLSKPFAFQHFELDKYIDVVTVGKMTQLCATMFSHSYQPKPGLLSQTFTASTSTIRAASYILKQFLNDTTLFGRKGKNLRFQQLWSERAANMPHLSGPFGCGGMLAMTVKNGSPTVASEFTQKLFYNGVMSLTAGSSPTRVRLLPPIPVTSEKQFHEACDIIEQTLSEI